MSILESTNRDTIKHTSLFIHNTNQYRGIQALGQSSNVIDLLKQILPSFQINDKADNSGVSFAFAELREQARARSVELGVELESIEEQAPMSSALFYTQLQSINSKTD